MVFRAHVQIILSPSLLVLQVVANPNDIKTKIKVNLWILTILVRSEKGDKAGGIHTMTSQFQNTGICIAV
jgi:hypothetical protein